MLIKIKVKSFHENWEKKLQKEGKKGDDIYDN